MARKRLRIRGIREVLRLKATGPPPDPVALHEELQRAGVTLLLPWEEYRQGHADGLGYRQFCEHYRRWRKRLKPSMRQQHRAGERTFTDYSGKKPSIVDRTTGEATKVEPFVAVLGASSYTYAEASQTQDLASWQGAHVRMSEHFGGTTEIWTPNNLKSAVTTPCRHESVLNGSLANMAAHYGVAIIPARVRKPKDKAKVESAVLVVQRWIQARLRNRARDGLRATARWAGPPRQRAARGRLDAPIRGGLPCPTRPRTTAIASPTSEIDVFRPLRRQIMGRRDRGEGVWTSFPPGTRIRRTRPPS